MKRRPGTHSGSQTNKSSVLWAQVGKERKAQIPCSSPEQAWCSRHGGSEWETDKTLISLSNKYRKGGCVHLIRNNREKLLTIIPNGLPVFWQWAQQLVCQFLTKCKNNNHPLSEPLICPPTFHLRLLRPPALSLVFWHLPHPLSTEALIHLLQGRSGKSHGKCWPFTLSYPGTLKP